MRTVRIFLLVLIIIGIILLLTQNIWVPKLVNKILEGEYKNSSSQMSIPEQYNSVQLHSIQLTDDLKKELLSHIYSNVELKEKDSFTWKPKTPNEVNLAKTLGSENALTNKTEGDINASVLLFTTSIEATSTKIYLIAETPESTCHACGAWLGAGIFEFDNGTWKTLYNDSLIELDGVWGTNGKGQLLKLGPQKIGFSFNSQSMSQGYWGSWQNIYYFHDNRFEKILNLKTGYGDDGVDCSLVGGIGSEATSTVETKLGQNPEFFDFVVRFSGTENNIQYSSDYRVKSCLLTEIKNKNIVYKWGGEKYEEVK